jgi:3-deoxy-D-manno-octulosonate 8-phosphate phosphatase (KDO 8-P phosphatase)
VIDLEARAATIRLLVLDVDGVLTDGRLYFSSRGEEMKSFHVRDGAGIVALLRADVRIAVISGREFKAVDHRMHELGVTLVRQGVKDKLLALEQILESCSVTLNEVACVGDDTPDVPLLSAARLGIAVADAHPAAKKAAHWITNAPGGCGAVREVCDLLLSARL